MDSIGKMVLQNKLDGMTKDLFGGKEEEEQPNAEQVKSKNKLLAKEQALREAEAKKRQEAQAARRSEREARNDELRQKYKIEGKSGGGRKPASVSSPPTSPNASTAGASASASGSGAAPGAAEEGQKDGGCAVA